MYDSRLIPCWTFGSILHDHPKRNPSSWAYRSALSIVQVSCLCWDKAFERSEASWKPTKAASLLRAKRWWSKRGEMSAIATSRSEPKRTKQLKSAIYGERTPVKRDFEQKNLSTVSRSVHQHTVYSEANYSRLEMHHSNRPKSVRVSCKSCHHALGIESNSACSFSSTAAVTSKSNSSKSSTFAETPVVSAR